MNDSPDFTEYVTFTLAGQIFGLPIERVQEVFRPSRITRVPLAGMQIAGVLNLRGRIVTAIDMRSRLDLPARSEGAAQMAIGIELGAESFGLLVDTLGEVFKLPYSEREANPVNLDRKLARVSAGVYRLDGQLLVARAAQNEDAMKTCLVVDDSSVIRKVARRILEGLEFQIVEAENGEEAIESCRKNLPDAILLDWNMPKMDGYDFLRVLRRLPGGDRPKVVFCTTENDVAHIARALHAGANEYIMKPFDKEIVEAKFAEVGLI
jgi:two-component system, chemotaxis family, chemotaxis protein CheY